MNPVTRSLLILTQAAWLLVVTPAQALEAKRVGEIEYVSGGVGEEERAALSAVRANYNLRLTMAQEGGAYLNEVALRLTPAAHGLGVVRMQAEGPLFFARLPAGEYLLTATHEGKEQSRKVSVNDHAPVDINLFWPAGPR